MGPQGKPGAPEGGFSGRVRQCRGRPHQAAAALAFLVGAGFLACGGGGEDAPRDQTARPTRRQAALSGQMAGAAHAAGEERVNRPPRARFETMPIEGWATLTQYRFSSSLSEDDADLIGQLSKRLDFDGDGTWDIPFTRRTSVHHVFDEPGEFRPRLLVRDTGGLMDSVVGEPIRVKRPCPPPDFEMTNINPNALSFGQTFCLSEALGKRVLVWFALPSK
jgi:hypothetical protein